MTTDASDLYNNSYKNKFNTKNITTVVPIIDSNSMISFDKDTEKIICERALQEATLTDFSEHKINNGVSSEVMKHIPWRLRILLFTSTAAQSLAASAITLFIITDLHFEPVQLNYYWMYMSWTGVTVPVVGFFADTLITFRERRRPMIVFGCLFVTMTYLLFYFVRSLVDIYPAFVVIGLLQNIAQSCISVPINGMMVQIFSQFFDEEENRKAMEIAAKEAEIAHHKSEEKTYTKKKIVINDEEGDNDSFSISPFSANSSSSIKACCDKSYNSKYHSTVCVDHIIAVKLTAMEREKELRRMRLMAAIQAEAMMWRSTGSLIGSIVHTIIVSFIALNNMLLVAGGMYIFIIVAVLNLGRRVSYLAPRGMRWQYIKILNCKPVTRSQHVSGNIELTSSSHQNINCERTYSFLKELTRRIALGCNFRQPGDGTIGIILVLLFVFVYTAIPSGGNMYFAYVATQFQFSNWLNSMNMCFGTLGSIVSSFIYMKYMARRVENGNGGDGSNKSGKNHRLSAAFFVFTFGSICAAAGYGTNMMLATGLIPNVLPIPPNVFVPIDNFLTSMFSQFSFLPILTVAAERCPVGFEASVFELFSMVSLCGGSFGSFLSSSLALRLNISYSNFNKLWILLVVCAISKLLPILLAYMLPVRHKAKLNAAIETVPGKGDGNKVQEADITKAVFELDKNKETWQSHTTYSHIYPITHSTFVYSSSPLLPMGRKRAAGSCDDNSNVKTVMECDFPVLPFAAPPIHLPATCDVATSPEAFTASLLLPMGRKRAARSCDNNSKVKTVMECDLPVLPFAAPPIHLPATCDVATSPEALTASLLLPMGRRRAAGSCDDNSKVKTVMECDLPVLPFAAPPIHLPATCDVATSPEALTASLLLPMGRKRAARSCEDNSKVKTVVQSPSDYISDTN